MHPSLLFLRGFLKRPGEVSSVIPTLKGAVRKICEKMDLSGRKVIVEYGPGTGVIVRHLLDESLLSDDSRVILIEKSPEFAIALEREIQDPRVRVFHGSAENVGEILRLCSEQRADYVISSIPLSVIPPDVRERILEETKRILAPDGSFIVYLFRPVVEQYLKEAFPFVERDFEPFNIPPLQIFTARKEMVSRR